MAPRDSIKEVRQAIRSLDDVLGKDVDYSRVPGFSERLMMFGKICWEASYKQGVKGDLEAMEAIYQWASDNLGHSQAALNIQAMTAFPADEVKLLAGARWYDQGLPRIVIEEKFAAMLMATDVGREQIDLVIPPWLAFIVELPHDLFFSSYDDTNTKYVPMRHLVVQCVGNEDGSKTWNFVLESDLEHGLQLFRHGVPTDKLIHVDADADFKTWEEDDIVKKADVRDERILRLIGRLIVSLCLAMSDPTNFHEQKRTKKRAPVRKARSMEPTIRTFVVGRPITIDCRPAIKNWLEGTRKGSQPTVQTLVRGHWKRQAHGPQMKQRKLIHIEPYWRGPEDAAIVARTVKFPG